MEKYLTGNHPVSSNGKVKESRYIYYENTKDKPQKCNWCGMKLIWRTGNGQSKFKDSLCVDHLDRDEENNQISNLVASCRQCNANRHTYGRRELIKCLNCGEEFLPRRRTTKYCSVKCASKNRPKRGSKAKHGTRVRYMYGCRCDKCIKANSVYWLKWYNNKKLC